MKRVTEKRKVCIAINKDGTSTYNEFIAFKNIDEGYKKLYKLENIEEKYGIDLITYFSTNKGGNFNGN